MQLRVALLPEQLPDDWCATPNTMAIVVDTLRFTTTACQALHAGAECIRIAAEIEEVRSLARQSASRYLLCGERHCRPIEGFDLGNSPYEYTPQTVQGSDLIFTTTNGTRAVAATRGATQVWLAALVNRRAVVQELVRAHAEVVWFICAGTDGQIALEDILVAGAAIDQLNEEPNCDAGQLAWLAWRASQAESADRDELSAKLQETFMTTAGGRNLSENGYGQDLEFAAQIDSLSVVPKSATRWDIFGPSGR